MTFQVLSKNENSYLEINMKRIIRYRNPPIIYLVTEYNDRRTGCVISCFCEVFGGRLSSDFLGMRPRLNFYATLQLL